jgi:hypothetical protein
VSLLRITINLTHRSEIALELLREATKDSRTDVVNASLRLNAALLDLVKDGRITVLRPDGTPVEVIIS